MRIRKHLMVVITATLTHFTYLYACTNFLITKGASADGSTMITYAADSHELYGELYFRPAQSYADNCRLQIYEWETGKWLGEIPQVKHTYQVVGNMNEYQLAIAETTFGGRNELVDSTGVLDYGNLIYITLQRAKTAREAIKVMTLLVEQYGYNSLGESFSISDPNEVWIMEMIGKGNGNKGAVWVARKIPDGFISGHANQSRITTFPLNDPENCLYSPDVVELAIEKGYYHGTSENFSFADAYAPIDFGGARFCEARVWSGFRRVNNKMNKYIDYAKGENLENRMPLWIKPDNKLSVKDVMELMRDYYQDTELDMTSDIGAGAFGCIIRWRPLTWMVDSIIYFNERAISTQQTAFSFVAQSRNWLPNPVGGLLWFGVDDTYSTVYSPVYCGINKVPHAFASGNGDIMTFSPDAAFWVFNQVSNLAYTRYSLMIPEIRAKQAALEEKYINESRVFDKKMTTLIQKDKPEAIKQITEFTSSACVNTVNQWQQLYQYLFVKYLDGNVKTPREVPPGYKYISPEVEQPGYSQQWYQQLIKASGNKFKYLNTDTH